MIRCQQCERQFDLQLDARVPYLSLEEALRYTQGNARRRLKDIIEFHHVISAEYGPRLLACTECDTLQQRFHFRVDYDEGKLYQSKTHESSFRCGKCRKPLVEPSKPTAEYCCSKCNSYSLADEPAGRQDYS